MNHIQEPAREGFLYHLWLDREFNQHLTTINGEAVDILEKGERNYDGGPDFLNALIRFNSNLLRGDIEIHSLAGDWYAHGHHRDPHYNNVILHLVTMDCPSSFRTIRADGEQVPTLNLDSILEKSAEELEITQENNGYAAQSQSSCGLAQQRDLVIYRIIEKAGDVRLSLKAGRFGERRHLVSWDQLIYQSILDALGFSKNQNPFRQLADCLPVDNIWRTIWNDPPQSAQKKCEAYLFGASGLLPGDADLHIPVRAGENHYVKHLQRLWNEFPLRPKIEPLKLQAWQFFRLRPANFPTRRIAAASVLVYRFMNDGFLGTLEKNIRDALSHSKKVVKELENLLTIKHHPYWSFNFTFKETKKDNQTHELQLLGADRARDIIVNVVLPVLLAYAVEIDDWKLKNYIREIYKKYPLLTDNEITRTMKERVFPANPKVSMINGARMQQGLIHLQKQVCSPESCAGCLRDKTLNPSIKV